MVKLQAKEVQIMSFSRDQRKTVVYVYVLDLWYPKAVTPLPMLLSYNKSPLDDLKHVHKKQSRRSDLFQNGLIWFWSSNNHLQPVCHGDRSLPMLSISV